MVNKSKAGASHEILHGTGGQNLIWPCNRRDASADMDRDATDIVADFLTFAGMKASTYFDPE